jgi:hypothetical protein
MSFSFLSAWHLVNFLLIEMNYLTLTEKVLAGLNEGML